MIKYIFLVLISSPVLAQSIQSPGNLYDIYGIKVEYYSVSNSGQLTPLRCEACQLKHYRFDQNTEFYTQGKPSNLKAFINGYDPKGEIGIEVGDPKDPILNKVYY